MAGHSHSANVRRRKEAVGAKRGKVFSKLARAIIVAARDGGGDPVSNLALKYAVDRAKAVSMPKDNIERAIKKGTGELDGGALETCIYEAIGPGGVLILIEGLTDNRNRTAPEIRTILERKNAHLGSVAWAFEQKGVIYVPADAVTEDALMEKALEAGAEDMERVGDRFIVTTLPSELDSVRRALADASIAIEDAELSMEPRTTVAVDEESARKTLSLFDELNDHDDVQNVYSNLDAPEALLAETQ